MGKNDQKAQENQQFQVPQMSNLSQIEEEQAFSFEIVPSVSSPSTHAMRNPAGITVYPSGLADANLNFSDRIRELVSEDPELDEGSFCTALGGDPKKGVVGVYVVHEGAEGAMPVRRNADGTYTLYLHGVFEKYPQLRPTGTRDCAVTLRTDKNGRECLVIHMKGGLVKRTTARSSSDSSSTEGTAK